MGPSSKPVCVNPRAVSMSVYTMPLAPSKRIRPVRSCMRLRAGIDVGIDKGEANRPRLVDQKGPYHRKAPRVIAFERWQVRAIPSVRRPLRLSDGEDQSKLTSHMVTHIAEDRKGQFLLFHHRE